MRTFKEELREVLLVGIQCHWVFIQQHFLHWLTLIYNSWLKIKTFLVLTRFRLRSKRVCVVKQSWIVSGWGFVFSCLKWFNQAFDSIAQSTSNFLNWIQIFLVLLVNQLVLGHRRVASIVKADVFYRALVAWLRLYDLRRVAVIQTVEWMLSVEIFDVVMNFFSLRRDQIFNWTLSIQIRHREERRHVVTRWRQ